MSGRTEQRADTAEEFAAHLRAFYSALPPAERALLKRVFALADATAAGAVQGFTALPLEPANLEFPNLFATCSGIKMRFPWLSGEIGRE